jgi:hypothetical protein
VVVSFAITKACGYGSRLALSLAGRNESLFLA